MSLFRALSHKHFSYLPRISTFCTITLNTSSPSPHSQTQTQTQTQTQAKTLRLLFQEAVGLSSKTQTPIECEAPTNEVKTKLWDLEQEIRQLKQADHGNKAEPNKPKRSLYGAFTGKEIADQKVETERKKVEDEEEEESPMIFKELSSDMKMFVEYLFDEGYFIDANFFRSGHLDFSCFNDSYGRDFIKFAADKFAKDHQDIAKWLSGSDLKKVALFGCPSLTRKNIFSAKRLRKYFEIQEDFVCSKCILKHSCKFVNQSVWKTDYKTLNLAVVMRVITLYALEAVPPELSVPDDIKASVSRLLNEIMKLSRTTS